MRLKDWQLWLKWVKASSDFKPRVDGPLWKHVKTRGSSCLCALYQWAYQRCRVGCHSQPSNSTSSTAGCPSEMVLAAAVEWGKAHFQFAAPHLGTWVTRGKRVHFSELEFPDLTQRLWCLVYWIVLRICEKGCMQGWYQCSLAYSTGSRQKAILTEDNKHWTVQTALPQSPKSYMM